MRKKFNASAPYTNISKLKGGEIVHIPTGVKVSKEQMMETIASARVIYVGEKHDNFAAHLEQLDIIKGLFKKYPGKVAVGMEMFRCSAQSELDGIEKGSMSLGEFNYLFDKQWTAAWRESYQPILDYLHEKSIPTIGLRPSKETEDIVRSGKTDKTVPEMDMNDQYHKARFMWFFEQNGVPANIAEKRYRMMVLWDEAMAKNVADFLANPKNKDKKMVVIAGGGHIDYGLGIAKRAYRRVPHNQSIISQVMVNDLDESLPLRIGDYAIKLPDDKPVANIKPKGNANSKP